MPIQTIISQTGSSGINLQPQNVTVTPTQTGTLYTIAQLLGSSSIISLVGATNSNLTRSGLTIQGASALGSNASQQAIVRETSGLMAVEYPVTFTTAAGVPAAPTLGTPVAGNGQISIPFTDGATNGSSIISHNVYASTTSGGETLLGNLSGASPFVDSGLTNGVTKYYKLSAVNSVGESPLSNEVSATPSAVVAVPQAASVVARYRTDQLPVVADGTAVSSWSDMMGGTAAAQTTSAAQPTYKVNRFNGKPSLLFNGAQYLACVNSAANAALSAGEISMMVVYGNVQSTTYGFLASLTNSTGFNVSANGTNTGPAVPAVDATTNGFGTGMFTISQNYNGLAARSPYYVNGQCVTTGVVTAYTPTSLGIGAGPTGIGGAKVEILEIIIWNRRLTAYEAIQAEMVVRDFYGQPYPWANQSYLYMAIGDSITYGYGTTTQASKNWPHLLATRLGLGLGTWANHGYIGANPGAVNTIVNGERLKDITTLTGKPVKFSYFEFYNQRGVTTTTAVANQQTLLNNVKSVTGNKIAFGTTPDYGNRGSEKSSYTSYWDVSANRTGLMDAYVPLHTDSLIGVDGACNNAAPWGLTFGEGNSIGGGTLSGCSITSGTNTLTITTKVGTPVVGTYVSGTGIPAHTYIQSITDTTHYVLSNNATTTLSSAALTFTTGDGIHLGDNGAAQMSTLWDAVGTM